MLVGEQLGPFAVEAVIGSGAMGTVYRARYVKNNQRVAIKLMAPALGASETALARFEREAAILKQLHHPNIVRLYATGRYHRNPFYAMEYVEGEPLDRVLTRRGRLPWEDVVALGRQLCAGLQHAHEQGIVHRDLKPSNLMLLADGTLKLTDFGIARDLDETRLTSTHSTVGTAAYMSPEQCRGERSLGHKSDLYSMGVVFYELLTGHRPFEAETPLEMFQLHVGGTVERPSRRVLDIPVWLDTLVCQLLEKSPERRPLDAAMVGQALGRIVEKVAAQQSAGVEAVKARAIDRPKGAPPPDEEDRAAARSLRAAMAGKRLRRRGRPFYQRRWVQALGILAALAVVIGLLALAFQPPGADTLYRQAQRLMESGDALKRADARRGPVVEFLRRFPDHPQAAQVRAWAEEVDVAELQEGVQRRTRLARNLGRVFEPEHKAEDLAAQAVRYEDFGDLALARNRWEALAAGHVDSAAHQTWVLLARKKSDELAAKLTPETPEQEAEARRALVDRRLDEAVQLKAKRLTREANVLAQDVIDLYHDDPALAEQVRQARQLLGDGGADPARDKGKP